MAGPRRRGDPLHQQGTPSRAFCVFYDAVKASPPRAPRRRRLIRERLLVRNAVLQTRRTRGRAPHRCKEFSKISYFILLHYCGCMDCSSDFFLHPRCGERQRKFQFMYLNRLIRKRVHRARAEDKRVIVVTTGRRAPCAWLAAFGCPGRWWEWQPILGQACGQPTGESLRPQEWGGTWRVAA